MAVIEPPEGWCGGPAASTKYHPEERAVFRFPD